MGIVGVRINARQAGTESPGRAAQETSRNGRTAKVETQQTSSTTQAAPESAGVPVGATFRPNGKSAQAVVPAGQEQRNLLFDPKHAKHAKPGAADGRLHRTT